MKVSAGEDGARGTVHGHPVAVAVQVRDSALRESLRRGTVRLRALLPAGTRARRLRHLQRRSGRVSDAPRLGHAHVVWRGKQPCMRGPASTEQLSLHALMSLKCSEKIQRLPLQNNPSLICPTSAKWILCSDRILRPNAITCHYPNLRAELRPHACQLQLLLPNPGYISNRFPLVL